VQSKARYSVLVSHDITKIPDMSVLILWTAVGATVGIIATAVALTGMGFVTACVYMEAVFG
jgi:hypothetical protein